MRGRFNKNTVPLYRCHAMARDIDFNFCSKLLSVFTYSLNGGHGTELVLVSLDNNRDLPSLIYARATCMSASVDCI